MKGRVLTTRTAACLAWVLILLAAAQGASWAAKKHKKVRSPSKAIVDFVNEVPSLKDKIKAPLALAGEAREAQLKATSLADGILAKGTSKTKKTAKKDDLKKEAEAFQGYLDLAQYKMERAKNKFQSFKTKYNSWRKFFIENKGESKTVAKKASDANLLQKKTHAVQSGLDKMAKDFSKLRDKESKIRRLCKQKGVAYPAVAIPKGDSKKETSGDETKADQPMEGPSAAGSAISPGGRAAVAYQGGTSHEAPRATQP